MARRSKDIWNREKDGNRREQRSFLRYAIVATVLFLLFLLLKKDSIVTWVQQIEQLQQENEDMDRRIRMMQDNRDTLERYAREHFYFSQPGDDVYIIE